MILVSIHVDTFQDVSDCLGSCERSLIHRRGFICQNLVSEVKLVRIFKSKIPPPFYKLVKWSPEGKASLSNLDILSKAEIGYLVEDSVRLPVPGSLRLVRFDRPRDMS